MKKNIAYYYSLNADISSKMVSDLVTETEVAPSTAYMYLRGKRKPMALYQKYIVKLVKKYFGENVTRQELFS